VRTILRFSPRDRHPRQTPPDDYCQEPTVRLTTSDEEPKGDLMYGYIYIIYIYYYLYIHSSPSSQLPSMALVVTGGVPFDNASLSVVGVCCHLPSPRPQV